MRKFIYLLVLVIIIGGFVYILPEIERKGPRINIKLDSEYVGLRPFDVEVKDEGKGLKKVSIVLADENGESTLYEEEYPSPIMEKKFTVQLDPRKLGMKEGAAEIRIMAEDRSHSNIFRGNKANVSKKVIIDLTSPRIEVVSTEHYINFGGSGLVIYKASSDAVKSGVEVGDYFFPGYQGYFKNPDVYMAFFAYPYNVSPDTLITAVAEDAAGNSKKAGFFYVVKPVRYKESTINVSDDFIERKVAPLLEVNLPEEVGLKEIFLKVNRNMRRVNEAEIKKISANPTKAILWNGAFQQLSNSQVEANFADKRTYMYNDEVVDQQYHLGYDLAVTRRYPVEAANKGVVVHADELGIYGNAVVIDHGFGLVTLYGHLSSINVKVGDKISKKQIVGRSGETGLAAGDHLHYAVYLNGVAVRPVEWWDNKWINDNILNKIQQARAEFGTAEVQKQSAPLPHKGSDKTGLAKEN